MLTPMLAATGRRSPFVPARWTRCVLNVLAHYAAVLGMGIAPLPTFLCNREPELVRVRPERDERQDVWLVIHADMRRAVRVRAVAGVAEVFGARAEP
jgi:DNA-binding transcriptional LysR family regulator